MTLGLMEMRREMGELEARDEGGGERLKKTHTLQRRTPALQTSQLSPEAIDLSGTISRVREKKGWNPSGDSGFGSRRPSIQRLYVPIQKLNVSITEAKCPNTETKSRNNRS